jgi:butyryl-CoA dehydrogenase
MHFDLNDELKELRDRARRFVEVELIPHELEVDETEAISDEVRDRLRERALEEGFWPMNVPKEMGGIGSSVLAQCIVQEQAGRATNGLWAFVGGPYNALMACNDEQRVKYLEPALRGEWTAAYAVTEPGAGSDTTNLQTTAVKKGDRWVIDGEKWFVSGGESSIAIIVHTVTAPGEETLFLVDHGTPGMSIKRIPRFMHRHPDRHPEILFENCEVPESQMLGGRGEANAISKEWFREERLHIAARSLGAAQRLIEEAKTWCAERETPRQVFDVQALLRGAGPQGRRPRGADLRRPGLLRGLRRRAPVPRHARRPHLGGHVGDHALDHRERSDEARSVAPDGVRCEGEYSPTAPGSSHVESRLG